MCKLVTFTSSTCGPCKRLKPELVAQSEKRGFELEIVELSDETRPRFEQYGIRAVPVIVYLNEEGNEVSRILGGVTPMSLEDRLKEWGL